MKVTIYENGLPRGMQVKKRWEPLFYMKQKQCWKSCKEKEGNLSFVYLIKSGCLHDK